MIFVPVSSEFEVFSTNSFKLCVQVFNLLKYTDMRPRAWFCYTSTDWIELDYCVIELRNVGRGMQALTKSTEDRLFDSV